MTKMLNTPHEQMRAWDEEGASYRVKTITWSSEVASYRVFWDVLQHGPDWMLCVDKEGEKIWINMAHVMNLYFETL